jgi:hypothetical protein
VAVLGHSAVDGDRRAIHRMATGVGQHDADGLHLPGAKGRGQFERGDVAAMRRRPRPEAELIRRRPARTRSAGHHHQVPARRQPDSRRGHNGEHGSSLID